jgi:AraC-like DNA-binding protein
MFFFRDRYRVHLRASRLCETSPQTVVVGPQTYHRIDLSMSGNIDAFTIHFQPSGFHHLFGVPMAELKDASYDGHAVIGDGLSMLEQQLASAACFEGRIRVAERYLVGQLRNLPSLDLVGVTANALFASNGLTCVAAMAASSGLTPRQFERRFVEQVGVAPKLYARIIRFNAAVDRKLACPNRTWTEIAHELHYYDQMHLVHDFHDLAGDSPTRLLAHLDGAPEFRTLFAAEKRPHRSD